MSTMSTNIINSYNMGGVFLSIIIPTYNNADFLQDCLESILRIKSVSYEVIVINDGSTDCTENILLKYSSQITIINQNNVGVSAARNAGINIANGQYLWFIDSDDTIDAVQFDLVMQDVLSNKSYTDIIGFGYAIEFYSDGKITSVKEILPYWTKLNCKEECFEELFASSYGISVGDYERWCRGGGLKEKRLKGFTWWMIFRRDLILQNHLCFSQRLSYNEDSVFLSELFLRCSNAVFYDNVVYHYARRGLGATVRIFNNDEVMALNKLSLFEEKIRIAKENETINVNLIYNMSFSVVLSYIEIICYIASLSIGNGRNIMKKYASHEEYKKCLRSLKLMPNRIIIQFILVCLRAKLDMILYIGVKVLKIFHFDARKVISIFR